MGNILLKARGVDGGLGADIEQGGGEGGGGQLNDLATSTHLFGQDGVGDVTGDREVNRQDDDVGQRGDDAQEDCIAHLEGQHGVHCEDDEEEEWNLKEEEPEK